MTIILQTRYGAVCKYNLLVIGKLSTIFCIAFHFRYIFFLKSLITLPNMRSFLLSYKNDKTKSLTIDKLIIHFIHTHIRSVRSEIFAQTRTVHNASHSTSFQVKTINVRLDLRELKST